MMHSKIVEPHFVHHALLAAKKRVGVTKSKIYANPEREWAMATILQGRSRAKKKKQIGINHTRQGIGRGHQPAGQVEGEQYKGRGKGMKHR
jgi:hypothetical protein